SSSRRRHTRSKRDWSSDVCSSDLPKILNMGTILNISADILICQTDFDGFHAFILSDGSTCAPIFHFAFPAVILYMCLIIYRWKLMECRCCTSRRRFSFYDQYHLESLQPIAKSGCPCTLAIFRPAKPAKLLRMNPVIHIKTLCHFSGQTDLNCLQTESLCSRSAHSSVCFPG